VFRASAGTFTIPPARSWGSLPALSPDRPSAPLAPPATLTGTGVNAPFISAWYINWANLSVK
jgi:hypothetical protein